MSVKQDIEYIKHELDTEEKFLSTIAHAERFWKRFKRPIIGVIAALVLGWGGFYAFNVYRNHQIDAANIALNKLLQNSDDKSALDTLKAKDTKLYQAYSLYSNAQNGNAAGLKELSLAQAKFVGELATYQSASIEKNETKLLEIGNDKSKIMSDMSLIDAGVIALQKNDTKTAAMAFGKVPQNSIAKPEAIALEHFSQAPLRP